MTYRAPSRRAGVGYEQKPARDPREDVTTYTYKNWKEHPEKGFRHHERDIYREPKPSDPVALGTDAHAGPKEIEIGAKTVNWTRVDVGGVDLLALQRQVEELEEANAKLMKMIEAMWFAPGMPGAPEAPDHPSFKK